MKNIIKLLVIFLQIVSITVLTSCGIVDNIKKLSENTDTLPDFPETPAEGNSWDYWTNTEYDDGEEITIDWYFSYPIGVSWNGNKTSEISKYITQKTGVNINLRSAVSDLSELTAMISGNSLPDLVTMYAVNNPTWVDLVENGQVYSMTDVANKWAPNFVTTFSKEYQDYYSGSDGKWYGIPAYYYDKETMEIAESQGLTFVTNGCFCARSDMLDWYLEEYYPLHSENEEPTTPQGFIQMCKAVRDHCPYYTAATGYSTVQFSYFDPDTLNTSMRWLAQYFCVPKEDSDGNLTYLEEQDEYLECLEFANQLYREGLITDSTFTDNTAQVNSNISNGYPFVIFGSYAEFNTGYYNWNCNSQHQDQKYIPIIFTNENGDAPLLQDVTGTGSTVTLMSKNCKRPDRVIKLLDFLNSTEGQMLMAWGIEGSDWEYDIEPGEEGVSLVDGKTYKYEYGRIKYTEKTLGYIAENQFFTKNPVTGMFFCNTCIKNMTSPNGQYLVSYSNYEGYNAKAAVTPYTFKAGLFNVNRDSSAYNYKEIVRKSTSCSQYWIKRLPMIIAASSKDECDALYYSTLNTVKSYGYKDVLAFDNECFQKMKAYYGIKYAWPKNDPDYVEPEINIKGYFGVYDIEIPEGVKR